MTQSIVIAFNDGDTVESVEVYATEDRLILRQDGADVSVSLAALNPLLAALQTQAQLMHMLAQTRGPKGH